MRYLLNFIFVVLIVFNANAQRGHRGSKNNGLIFLAEKSVDFGVDHDIIQFGNAFDDFRKLRIKVTDTPLYIDGMKIFYDNGQVQFIDIKTNFRQGEWTRTINLGGGRRNLSRIEFLYSTNGVLRGKSRVQVWGK